MLGVFSQVIGCSGEYPVVKTRYSKQGIEYQSEVWGCELFFCVSIRSVNQGLELAFRIPMKVIKTDMNKSGK